MLDGFIKPRVAPILDGLAVKVSQSGLGATTLLIIAFVVGFTACFAAGMQLFLPAAVLVLLNRFLSGLSHAVARQTSPTDIMLFLSTFCDFLFYGAFAFFFSLAMPAHSMAAAFLIFSYLAMGMAYLGFSLYAARRGDMNTPNGGIVENAEITIFMIVCCLYPAGFSAFAALFAFLCWATAGWRVMKTLKLLKV